MRDTFGFLGKSTQGLSFLLASASANKKKKDGVQKIRSLLSKGGELAPRRCPDREKCHWRVTREINRQKEFAERRNRGGEKSTSGVGRPAVMSGSFLQF